MNITERLEVLFAGFKFDLTVVDLKYMGNDFKSSLSGLVSMTRGEF